jgi:hypothetical protein
MNVKQTVRFLFLGAWATTLTANASAGLMHSAGTTPGQAYLNYAQNFPYVGWLGRTNENGQTVFGGSGVLIDSHWVLTAAHVVLPLPVGPSSAYRVGFTNDFFEGPGENQFAKAVYINPAYSDILQGPDLALLYFEDPFTIEPAPLYVGEHDIGAEYGLIGFGRSGTPQTGFTPVDGKKRAGTNALTNIDSPQGYLRARFLSPGEPGWNQLGILAGPGDSGGAFIRFEDGEFRLAGIAAANQGASSYGSLSYATYFTPGVAAWINETMALHAVPEPATLPLLAAAAIGLATVARKTQLRTLIVEERQ